MHFTPQQLWASTGTPVRVVLLTLLVMAVWCFYVAIERFLALNKARKQSRELGQALGPAMSAGDGEGALKIAQDVKFQASYLGHLIVAGLKEFVARPDSLGIESVERAIERQGIAEDEDLRKGMNILATTGSTAPFVGLVGTIFGIINAFQGMAQDGGGGLASVSAGIAEALITTAIGIAVAIIGVWLFNYFTAAIERITNDMNVSSRELLDWCHKQTWPDRAAAK